MGRAPLGVEHVETQELFALGIDVHELRDAWQRVGVRLPNDEINAKAGFVRPLHRLFGFGFARDDPGQVQPPADQHISKTEVFHGGEVASPGRLRRRIEPIPGAHLDRRLWFLCPGGDAKTKEKERDRQANNERLEHSSHKNELWFMHIRRDRPTQ